EPEQLGFIEVEECVEVNDELKVQQSNDSNTNKKARTARGPRFILSRGTSSNSVLRDKLLNDR
ncbi:hypothetical protein ACSLOE_30335, partial [Escherichia coli]